MARAKECGRCGADVTGRSRGKLPDGSYVCRRCMHEERRAAERVLAFRRNLIWPVVLALVTAVLFALVWATSRPPGPGRR